VNIYPRDVGAIVFLIVGAGAIVFGIGHTIAKLLGLI
jgi:hypothetical protein